MRDLSLCHTPARRDKHLGATLLFAAVLTLNHKLALSLTLGELVVLGGVLGVYMGQSQAASVAKMKVLIAPTPHKGD
jgi:hypothetical protein